MNENQKQPDPEYKYFKFDHGTANIIGHMLSTLCDQMKIETKNDKENALLCRNAFFEYIGQFNKQLTAGEIAEIISSQEQEERPEQIIITNDQELIPVERPKLILLN